MSVGRKMRKMSPGMAMVDAHMSINGCQVFVGHPDGDKAQAAVKEFRVKMTNTVARAKCMNLYDMYNTSFDIREKMLSGEFN